MDRMTSIYVIMGVLASVTLFLYIIPLFRRLAEKSRDHKMNSAKKFSKETSYEEDEVQDMGNCPVCGAKLSQDVKLYTRSYRAQPRDKIFIKGCSQCYQPDKKGKK